MDFKHKKKVWNFVGQTPPVWKIPYFFFSFFLKASLRRTQNCIIRDYKRCTETCIPSQCHVVLIIPEYTACQIPLQCGAVTPVPPTPPIPTVSSLNICLIVAFLMMALCLGSFSLVKIYKRSRYSEMIQV